MSVLAQPAGVHASLRLTVCCRRLPRAGLEPVVLLLQNKLIGEDSSKPTGFASLCDEYRKAKELTGTCPCVFVLFSTNCGPNFRAAIAARKEDKKALTMGWYTMSGKAISGPTEAKPSPAGRFLHVKGNDVVLLMNDRDSKNFHGAKDVKALMSRSCSASPAVDAHLVLSELIGAVPRRHGAAFMWLCRCFVWW